MPAFKGLGNKSQVGWETEKPRLIDSQGVKNFQEGGYGQYMEFRNVEAVFRSWKVTVTKLKRSWWSDNLYVKGQRLSTTMV